MSFKNSTQFILFILIVLIIIGLLFNYGISLLSMNTVTFNTIGGFLILLASILTYVFISHVVDHTKN